MLKNLFRYFERSREVIQLAVMMYVRYPLSLRNIEDLLHELGTDVYHENIRLWVDRFVPLLVNRISARRSAYLRQHTEWQWHLDEVYVRINGVQHYLWRAVDHEGEALEPYVTKKRDKLAALRFLKKATKRYCSPRIVVTDRLRSYGAAMKEIGILDRQKVSRYRNNRAESSHLQFRRRERGMTRFRRMPTLQKLVSTHASIYNHFNHQRHLESRARFKSLRDASLNEWRQLIVA